MRKIAVITGSRAEYGLLYWLIKELHLEPQLELQLIVTGMHLSPDFGMTVDKVIEDGFPIAARVDLELTDDTPVAIGRSIGIGVVRFAETLAELKPDILVLLGDRFELLSAAQAAMVALIPIAHIHGGESTEGLIDEPIRHALTKMSQLHFVAADAYAKRVVQLGEHPNRVFNFGAPGLDHVSATLQIARKDLEASLGITFQKRLFVVTYHPVTLHHRAEEAVENLLTVLGEYEDTTVIFSQANADTGSRKIISLIESFTSKYSQRSAVFSALGIQRYMSLVSTADVVIGNSSSGIIEVPILGTPTVNIGDRQRGRLRAASVIDCDESIEAIRAAINKSMSSEFVTLAAKGDSPYGRGGVSKKIKETLQSVELENLLIKRFYDLEFSSEPHHE